MPTRKSLHRFALAVIFGMMPLLGVAMMLNPHPAPAAGSQSENTVSGPNAGGVIQLPAEQANDQTEGTRARKDRKHDVSPPLRKIKPIAIPRRPTFVQEGGEEAEESANRSLFAPDQEAERVVRDPVEQLNFGLESAMALPAPAVNFDAMGNYDGVYPPDSNADVGPNHIVEMVNLGFKVFDKRGVTLYGPAATKTLWSGFGGPCETRNDGDGVVLYDQFADRWILSQFVVASGGPYGECLAVSTGGDPMGTWYRYWFQFSTTVMYDYPRVAVWSDGYYLSFRRFSGTTYAGASVVALNREAMLNGQTAAWKEFLISPTYGALLPSDADGKNLPPPGAPNFYVSSAGGKLNVWKFHVDWANLGNSTFTGPTVLTPATFSALCATSRSCVPQPGTSVKVDALGDRLMHRVAYRNWGYQESLLMNQTVKSSNNVAGIRWYEIRTPSGTPYIYQQGTYSPDSTWRWLASIAMDASGNIGLGYNVSSSSVYPGIRFTGRLHSDPAGQMPQGEGTFIAGGGSQTAVDSRWGDYAMMTVDPVDDCTFWFTGAYIVNTGMMPWRTRIGSFKFPSCGSPPPIPSPTPTLSPTITKTPSNTPTPSKTPTPSRTPTNTATPKPNVLQDPSFEGAARFVDVPDMAWTETSNSGRQVITTTFPRTGAFSAELCGPDNCVESVRQVVTIPSGGVLTYYWYMTSAEGTKSAYDTLKVELWTTTGTLVKSLLTLSNKNTPRSTWNLSTLSLSRYPGKTYELRFTAKTNATVPTQFYLDDVAVR